MIYFIYKGVHHYSEHLDRCRQMILTLEPRCTMQLFSEKYIRRDCPRRSSCRSLPTVLILGIKVALKVCFSCCSLVVPMEGNVNAAAYNNI